MVIRAQDGDAEFRLNSNGYSIGVNCELNAIGCTMTQTKLVEGTYCFAATLWSATPQQSTGKLGYYRTDMHGDMN